MKKVKIRMMRFWIPRFHFLILKFHQIYIFVFFLKYFEKSNLSFPIFHFLIMGIPFFFIFLFWLNILKDPNFYLPDLILKPWNLSYIYYFLKFIFKQIEKSNLSLPRFHILILGSSNFIFYFYFFIKIISLPFPRHYFPALGSSQN